MDPNYNLERALDGNRTRDTEIRSLLFYQLNYRRTFNKTLLKSFS